MSRTIHSAAELAAYLAKLEPRMNKVIAEIVEQGADAANSAYGASWARGEVHGSTGSVIATGDGLSFSEFGAGTVTDSGHPYAGMVGYDVEPGSWSKTHKRTYQNWQKAGSVGEYRYNMQPTRGMYRAGQEMRRIARIALEREFG